MEKITWTTIEYLHREKTPDWYWIVGIITVSIGIISIILNNLIFAILIIISSITLTLFASRPPQKITVEINESEIKIGETKHPYKELSSFWIETKESIPRILVKPNKLISPLMVIFLENQNPESVEKLLSQHLEKEEMTEPFLEKLLVYLGF